MAKTTIDKRTLVNIAAGTVAAVAVLFGISQCNGKNAAVRDADVKRDSLLIQMGQGIVNLHSDNEEIKDLIEEHDADIKDLIEEHDADIKDAIAAHDDKVNKNLDTLKANCKPCQKKAKPAKKATAKKPAPAKPAPAKPVPAKPAPVEPQVVNQTPDIYVTPDTVIVHKVPKQQQTVIINGDNNGSVNTGVIIVNGDNSSANNSNGAEKQKNTNADLGRIVSIKRVRCR